MFCVLNVFVCPPFLHFHTFPCKYIWLINSSESIELPIGDWWIRFSIFPEHILGILERLHVSRKSISFSLFSVRVHKGLMTIALCRSSMLFNTWLHLDQCSWKFSWLMFLKSHPSDPSELIIILLPGMSPIDHPEIIDHIPRGHPVCSIAAQLFANKPNRVCI